MSYFKLFTFILSIFVVGMVELVVAGVLTLISDDLNISPALAGQLVTIYALTFAISGPLLVKLTERFNPKYVLLISLAIFMIGNALNAAGPTFTVIVIGRIIASAAASIIVVKILALTVVLSRPEARGRMLGLVYVGFSGANVFGVPIGTKLGELLGWRATFWLIVLFSLVAAVLLMFQLPNKIATQHSEPADNQLLHPKEATKYISITFILLAANSAVFTYISPIMLDQGYNLTDVSLALFVAGIGSMTGTSFGGAMTDRFGSRKWLLISLSVFMLSLLVFNFVLSSFVVLLFIILIWNFSEWSTNPAIQMGIINQVKGDTSQIMAWNMSALNAGIGLGALIGGILLENFSIYSSPFIGASLIAVCLMIAYSIKR
ncbi:MFS transporter [Macrococcus hajekii]|uniref:Quinolone resistance protein NorA n=1 Tax=Macrococcus hajekii TaxID=198482 RepID=A0A4R6BJC9_9STAP|nr:MFS transporter [Macrococcus hajekii]TDM01686.1 MFS transporter [Macrococcus hajekii]GGB06588.1 chloramphenicol resistance protein [Macrococcus hajekii]